MSRPSHRITDVSRLIGRSLFALPIMIFLLKSNLANAAECHDPFHLADRSVVIEPCTQRLASSTLTADERVRALEFRARGYRAAGRDDDALKDIEAGLALSPDDAALYTVRAGIKRDRNDFEGAWHDGQRAVELEPEKVRHYEILINIAVFAHNFPLAHALIEHASELDRDNVAIMIWRYFYHWRKGESLEAIKALDQALASPRAEDRKAVGIDWHGRRNDTDVVLRLIRADELRKRNDWKKAAEAYDDAVAFARNAETLTERAYFNLNRPVERGSKATEDALADADAALRLDPTFDRAHMTRALALKWLNRPTEALEELDTAIKLAPAMEINYLIRARLHRELGHTEDTIRDFRSYIEASPSNFIRFVETLGSLGYLLETPDHMEMTPELLAGIRACALDKGCF